MFRSIGLKRLLRQIPSVRAVVVLSFVMILATVLSTAALLLDLRQKELEHAHGEIVSLSRILSEQTTRTFEGVALMMRNVHERLSDDRGQHLELNSPLIQLLLKARSAGLPQVKSIFLVDRQGFGVNSSRPDFVRQLSMTEREFFHYFVLNGESDEIYISRAEKARVDGQWAYYVSMRLLDASGRFRGVLAAAINIDHFESLYDSIGLDFVRQIQLFNREGSLLAGQPHCEELFGRIVVSSKVLEELQRLPEGGVLEASEKLPEGRRFVAYRQVAKYPLVVSAAIDEYEALTPWREIVRPVVAGVAVVLLFVLITTTLMVRSLLRKEALESALKESDEQLRQMVQSVKDAIVTVDSGKRIVLFNDAAGRMFGVRAEEAVGCEIEALLSRCLGQSQLMNLLRCLEEGWRSPAGLARLYVVELQRERKEFPVELSLSTTAFRGEILLTAIFRDLAERQRVERQLLETNRQLQELSTSLQNVREEERIRIARELHDELGQLLTGIRMEISWLGGRMLPEQQALVGKIASVKGQIDQTIATVRRISSELRPLVLDDLGFAAAAGWYVRQFSERTGLPVTLDLHAADPELGSAAATALFRILQESLTNIARHADAKMVEVRLIYEDGRWALSIQDDGRGFISDRERCSGIGLIGMRERAQMLGGSFSVDTSTGKGTRITAIIPATRREEANDGETTGSIGG